MQRDAIVLGIVLTLGVSCETATTPNEMHYTSGGAYVGETAASETGSGNGMDDDVLDLGNSGDADGGDGDGDDACVSISEATQFVEVPADIIFIVDNSGSMSQEANFVQSELNGFSAQIEQSGIDAHVVLISSYPDDSYGICIAPPLGGGGCPETDNNPPRFVHVDQRIDSHDALQLLLATHPLWQASMRPDATKHIVVVSDDESELAAGAFLWQFSALDPSYEPYVVHGIVCPWACPESAAIGYTYLDLIEQTGGVLGDLCQQNFQGVFDSLAAAVIEGAPLSCQIEIPPPPLGLSLDPNQVNVEIDHGDGNVEDIPRVTDLADCMNHPSGWYYDEPIGPTWIYLCPETCALAQSQPAAAISVKFGCQTLVP